MRTRFQGIGPYNSFRTGHQTPVDDSLRRPERRCTICGAVLSPWNDTDTCCCHQGSYEIPEWLEFLAQDRGVAEVNALAQVLTGTTRSHAERDARSQAIREAYANGASQYELAKLFHVGRSTIQSIVSYRPKAVCRG